MKTIEIQFTRKVTFNKIVTVSDSIAKQALALDGEDLTEPRSYPDKSGWVLITEDLVNSDDVLDMDGEIENLSVEIFKKGK